MAVIMRQCRGLQAAFVAMANAEVLEEGVLYVCIDTKRIYMATNNKTYVEVGRGGEWLAAPLAGDLTSSAISYAQTWLKSSVGATPVLTYMQALTPNNATSLVLRDSNGRAKFTDPAVAQDAATKNYVDTADATKVTAPIAGDLGSTGTNYVMLWSKTASGATPTYALRVVGALANNIPARDANGNLGGNTPVVNGDYTPKSYVDVKLDAPVTGDLPSVSTDYALTFSKASSAGVPSKSMIAIGSLANNLVRRDSNGNLSGNTPVGTGDYTPQNYVDNSIIGTTPKNYIVNGDFHHIRRNGTMPAGTAFGFGFHRWFSQANSRSRTVSQVTLGSTDAGGHPRSCYRCTYGTSVTTASKHIRVGQRIPGSNIFKGKTVTIAFWARSSVINRRIAYSLYRQSGSTDVNASAHVNGGYVTITAVNLWQHFCVTLDVPNTVLGDTKPLRDDLERADFAFTELLFWFDAGTDWNAVTGSMGPQTTTGTADITGVFLGVGDLTKLSSSYRLKLFQTQSYDELAGVYEKFYRRFNVSYRTWIGGNDNASLVMCWPIPSMMGTPVISTITLGYVQNLSTWSLSATRHTVRLDATAVSGGPHWGTVTDTVVELDAENVQFV